jgi:hypothetical protein
MKETAMATGASESARREVSSKLPFAALTPGSKEWEAASRQLLETWKRQLDTTLRLVDAAVEGSLEMRSSQLAAAMETHARDLHAETSLSRARSVLDLWTIQMDWMTGNLERSMTYWAQMFQAANDAGGKILESLREQAQALSKTEEPAKNLPRS